MSTTSFTTAATASNVKHAAVADTTLNPVIDEIEAKLVAARTAGNGDQVEKALRELQALSDTLTRLHL